MRNLLTAGERPSPALRPFFPTLGAPATGRTEDGDSRELCDVLGPRGPQMSHTSPAMTRFFVSCGGPGHHEAQKLVRGWWLEPQERPMLFWGGGSSHQERPMLFRGWWLEPGPGHQPAEPLVILGVSLPASTRQRQDNFLATRICPVRTAQVPGISSTQRRSGRTITWRQEFVRSEPPGARNFVTARPQRQENFLATRIFLVRTVRVEARAFIQVLRKVTVLQSGRIFSCRHEKILPFVLPPEPIARLIHR